MLQRHGPSLPDRWRPALSFKHQTGRQQAVECIIPLKSLANWFERRVNPRQN